MSKLPGVTTQNVYSILNNAESLENLLSFSKVRFFYLIGFFRSSFFDEKNNKQMLGIV